MDWLKKTINFKKYFALSLITISIVEISFCRNYKEGLVFLVILIASFLNQTMLIMGLKTVFTMQQQKPTAKEIWRAAILLMGKTLILGCAFYIGVHFVRDRIIIGLFIYTVQLVNLFISMKKNSLS